jgi:hypothetical protein
MNTGIQDAHNLAWKLAAVLTDRADPTLLSTYQPERRPVAQANATLSVNNWREAIRVPQALGLDPGAASLVNKVVSSAPLPAPVASWLLDAALTAGRGLANAVIPLRRSALQDILASGMSLRLQFPREDLGFVYSSGAVDAGSDGHQGRPQRQEAHAGGSSKRRGNVYQPAIVVGGRLPHCWLQMLGPGGQVHKVGCDRAVLHASGTGLAGPAGLKQYAHLCALCIRSTPVNHAEVFPSPGKLFCSIAV